MTQQNGTHAKKIFSSERWLAKIFLITGILLTLLTSTSYYFIPELIEKSAYSSILIISILPLFPLSMALAGWHFNRLYRTFGSTPLTPNPPQGQIGGQLGGTIQFNEAHPEALLTAKLVCYLDYKSRDNNKDITEMQWCAEQPIFVNNEGKSMSFVFDIPQDQFNSGKQYFSQLSKHKVKVTWKVEVYGYLKDEEFDRSWTIPVVIGNETSTIIIPKSHSESTHTHQRLTAESSLKHKIEFQPLNNGIKIISGSKDVIMNSLLFALGGIIFFFVGLALLPQAISGDNDLRIVSPLFLFFGIALLASSLYTAFRRVITTLNKDTIDMRRQWFSKTTFEQKTNWAGNNSIQLKARPFMDSFPQDQQVYDMYAQGIDNSKNQLRIKIVENIKGKKVAEALLRNIMDALNSELSDELGI